MIGPNGTGKSHLVSAIAMVFTDINRVLNHEKRRTGYNFIVKYYLYGDLYSMYASTFPYGQYKMIEWFCHSTKRLGKMNQENQGVNYSMVLKNYNQNGRGRSMRKFCEDEGYDYNKFMQYAKKGQKELSVLKEADSKQSESPFIPLVVESGSATLGVLGISEVRVRFTNGMGLTQSNGDINELFGIVRKLML